MSRPHRFGGRIDTYRDFVITLLYPGGDEERLWRATVRRFGTEREAPVTFRAETEIEMVDLARKFVDEVMA